MKLSVAQLRRIIKEELEKHLDEIAGDLGTTYPEDTLKRAGLVAKTEKPEIKTTPFEPGELEFVLAGDVENKFGVPKEKTTSIVQKVLDLLRKKGISLGE
jgi:hypothetical protein